MKKELTEKILQETESGYDLIADKFSETRNKKFWSDLEFIRDYAKDGDKILDFGCGNGRLLELFPDKNIKYFGADISGKLIDIAQRKYYSKDIKFQKISNSGKLEYEDNFFNVAYSIAVFHHLPGKDIREATAKELFRVLQPGGILVITVWNLWQKKYRKSIFQNWMKKITGRSELDWNDCYISFKDNQGNVFQRYHHAYAKKELRNIFEKVGFKVEKCELIGNVNIIAVLRKK
jgi:ubiquinone/menaquinone biosynthesis C-methylase UbiE